MTTVEKLEEIIQILEVAKRDAEKVDAGVIAAGIRLRKDALQAAKQLSNLRQLVLLSRKDKE